MTHVVNPITLRLDGPTLTVVGRRTGSPISTPSPPSSTRPLDTSSRAGAKPTGCEPAGRRPGRAAKRPHPGDLPRGRGARRRARPGRGRLSRAHGSAGTKLLRSASRSGGSLRLPRRTDRACRPSIEPARPSSRQREVRDDTAAGAELETAVPDTGRAADSMLMIDRFLPRYDFTVVHASVFRAPPEICYRWPGPRSPAGSRHPDAAQPPLPPSTCRGSPGWQARSIR